jgi:hypothetical protein
MRKLRNYFAPPIFDELNEPSFLFIHKSFLRPNGVTVKFSNEVRVDLEMETAEFILMVGRLW